MARGREPESSRCQSVCPARGLVSWPGQSWRDRGPNPSWCSWGNPGPRGRDWPSLPIWWPRPLPIPSLGGGSQRPRGHPDPDKNCLARLGMRHRTDRKINAEVLSLIQAGTRGTHSHKHARNLFSRLHITGLSLPETVKLGWGSGGCLTLPWGEACGWRGGWTRLRNPGTSTRTGVLRV